MTDTTSATHGRLGKGDWASKNLQWRLSHENSDGSSGRSAGRCRPASDARPGRNHGDRPGQRVRQHHQACTAVYDPDYPALALGTVCFQPEGDILQVQDNTRDGHSIALRWVNYYAGERYREGACVESRGAGSIGKCNKDFHEGSTIVFKACLWESATDTMLRCGYNKNITT